MCEGTQLFLASRTRRIFAPNAKPKVGTGYRPLEFGIQQYNSVCPLVTGPGHGGGPLRGPAPRQWITRHPQQGWSTKGRYSQAHPPCRHTPGSTSTANTALTKNRQHPLSRTKSTLESNGGAPPEASPSAPPEQWRPSISSGFGKTRSFRCGAARRRATDQDQRGLQAKPSLEL